MQLFVGIDKELTRKKLKETFLGHGNVLYLDCGGGYMGVYICQNSSKMNT